MLNKYILMTKLMKDTTQFIYSGSPHNQVWEGLANQLLKTRVAQQVLGKEFAKISLELSSEV